MYNPDDDQFIGEMADHRLLSRDEEIKLAKAKDRYLALLEQGKPYTPAQHKALRAGKQARKDLIIFNMRLIIHLSAKFTGRGLELKDLIQEGVIGMTKAIDKYDYTRGYKFSTYATWWIRQSMGRAVADQSRTIRMPVHTFGVASKILSTRDFLTQSEGRQPTLAEIGAEIDLSPEKVAEILNYNSISQPVSLDEERPADNEPADGNSFLLFLSDNSSSVSDVAEQRELAGIIQKALEMLFPREAMIIGFRYGLNGYSGSLTLEEVGEKFGITRERVRQIEAGALRKLRHPRRARQLKGLLKD